MAFNLPVMRTRRKELAQQRRDLVYQALHTEKRTISGDEHRVLSIIDKSIDQLDSDLADGRSAGREDFGGEAEKRTTPDPRAREQQQIAFAAFVAGGFGNLPQSYQQRWREVEEEFRALSATTGPSTIASGTAGATLIQQAFPFQIDVATKDFGGVPEVADFVDTPTGAPLPYPTMDDTANSAEITAENAVVAGADVAGGSAEVDPVFGAASFGANMYDSGFVRIPVQLAQDAAFDTAVMLEEALRTRIYRKLNVDCTTGDGSAKPTGIVNSASAGVIAASPTAIAFDDLVGLKYSLDKSYRMSPTCGWMMSDTTVKALAKLKDQNLRPLFNVGGTAEGIANDAPQTLLGHPIQINNAMAAGASASAKPILFGDFKKYKIRRVLMMAVIRVDQLFISQLQIGFLAYQRFDGKLVNTAAVKYLANPAS